MKRAEAGRALSRLRARVTTTCEWCGAPFQTYLDRIGKFCTPRCRQAEWVSRHREQERQRLKEYRERRRRPAQGGPEGQEERGNA